MFCSIWSIYRTLSSATTPGQSGPGRNGNEGGTPHSPKLKDYWNLTIRLFSVIIRTLVGGSYLSAEVQLVYSTAPADLASLEEVVLSRIGRTFGYRTLCYVTQAELGVSSQKISTAPPSLKSLWLLCVGQCWEKRSTNLLAAPKMNWTIEFTNFNKKSVGKTYGRFRSCLEAVDKTNGHFFE